MSSPRRHAAVFSGGGAKGAYEVGVMSALFAGRSPATGHRPLEPEVFTGTSVGAYNASFLASHDEMSPQEAIAALAEIWRKRVAHSFGECGNGVFRLRGVPLQFLEPGCLLHPLEELVNLGDDALFLARNGLEHARAFLASTAPLRARLLASFDLAAFFSPAPLHELIEDTIDWEGLRRTRRRLMIAASRWIEGTVRVFEREDVADRYGPIAIEASAAIPGIFPPVEIDGEPLIDGGVLLNTPLRPAIRAGADVIHVVFLDPIVGDVTIRQPPNTIDTVYRTYEIMLAAMMRADVRLADAITDELQFIARLEEMGVDLDDPVLVAKSRVLTRFRHGRPYRPIEIHKYRPDDDLGGGVGLLAFEEGFVNRLIAQGERDAEQHDCEREGCVRP